MHDTLVKSNQYRILHDLSNLHFLHRAILEDDLGTLSKALETGADPNSYIKDEFTSLHIAANYGKAEAVEKLLSHGADANILSQRGHTALHLAAANGDENTVRALMKFTNLNLREPRDDYTATHIAASSGRACALAALCEEADIEATTDDGMTPLVCAVYHSHNECIRILAGVGANINVRVGPKNHTPLMIAAIQGQTAIVSTLIALGAEIDATEDTGSTAVCIAAYHGHDTTLETLITHGADLDSVDKIGASPLFHALKRGHLEATLVLLKQRVRTNTAYTAHKETALHIAVSKEFKEAVQRLLDKGADVHARDADGDSPLQWAVEKGNVAIIESFIAAGADVNERNSETAATVLSWAIRGGNAIVTKLLLKHGAQIGTPELELLQPQSGTSESAFEACKRLANGETIAVDQECSNEDNQIETGVQEPLFQKKGLAASDESREGAIRYRIIVIPSQEQQNSLIAPLQHLVQHKGVRCDGPYCSTKKDQPDIVDIRYRCVMCETIDFCAKCIASFEITHDTLHPMIKCRLPTRFESLEDVDDYTKTKLVQQEAPNLNAADVKQILIANSENHNPKGELPEMLFENSEPDIFLLSQEPDGAPYIPRREIKRYGSEPSGDTVAFYNISKNAEVSVRFHKIGENSDAKLQDHDLVSHASVDLTMAALIGKLRLFDYRTQPEFYQMAQAGKAVTRVIDILPGKFGDKLDIRLRAIDIMNTDYTALSYTWKQTRYELAYPWMDSKEASDTFKSMADLKHPVYVQNVEQSFLVIGSGLNDALQRFRSEHETVCLWADQLCINQKHLDERKMQVGNMKHIFNRAAKVIVWIGEDDEHTELVFDTMKKIAGATQLLGFIPSPELLLDDEVLELPSRDSPIWASIVDHISRPVFGRCWVIQEIVVAQKVVVRCGQHLMDWGEFVLATSCLSDLEWVRGLLHLPLTQLHKKGTTQEINGWPNSGLTYVIQIKGIREDFQAGKELSLESLVYLTSHFEATDPVDKIYSILGIQSAQKTSADIVLQPDYSLSVRDAYIKATKAIVCESRSFAIWGFNDTVNSKKILGLPSWVPDYSIVKHNATAFNRPIPKVPYRASGDSVLVAKWPYDDQPNILVTSSYKAKTIVQVSDHAWTRTSMQKPGPVFEEWMRLASTKPEYVTGEDVSRAFTRTLFADSTLQWRKSPVPASYHTAIALQICFAYVTYMQEQQRDMDDQPMYGVLKLLFDEIQTSETNETDPDYNDAFPAMNMTCADRRFFVCYSGYFGIGPRDMRAGDEIHILPGCHTPFVLRRAADCDVVDAKASELAKANGKSLYTLVGECFSLGLMQGEALNWADFAWEEIYLC